MDKEPSQTTPQPEENNAETAKKPTRRNKNSLLIYVAIMFAVAFLLVLYSFLTQRRDSNQTINDLQQTSNTAVVRVQELEEEYTTLSEENRDLTNQVEQLEQELTALQNRYDALSQAKTDVEQDLAQANTDKTAAEAKLEETADDLEALETEKETLTAQVETLTNRQSVDVLLEAGALDVLELNSGALAEALTELDALIAGPSLVSLDTQQRALYEQLQQKLKVYQVVSRIID